MNPKEIHHILEQNVALERVTLDLRILESFVLGLIEYVEEGKLFSSKKDLKTKWLFKLPGVEALQSKGTSRLLCSELLDNSSGFRSLPIENFIIHKDLRYVASNDLRVVVRNLSGKIPQNIMHNIASVSLLMIAGLIDYNVANSYIRGIMVKYGQTRLEYQASGYLIVDLGVMNNNISFKSSLKTINDSK